MDPDLTAALKGERALLTRSVRHSAEAVSALLHPDFFEYGSSGREWTRESIIEALTGGPPPATLPVPSGMTAVRLADEVILVTYTTERDSRRALRSSLWRKHDGRWLVYFHQGTPVPPG